MFRAVAVSALVMLSAASAFSDGRPSLSGRVSGVLPVGEYTVTSVLTVRRGESFGLQAGSVLYFEPFTRIDVFGELSVDGSPAAPVLLTSVKDTGGAAQAFDWNGVEAGGQFPVVRMRHARICNSVYGLKIDELSANVELDNVFFLNNGYASLVRGGQEIPVAASEPFSAAWNTAPKPQTPEEPAAANTPAKKQKNKKTPAGKKRAVFRSVGAGAAAAGLIVCGVSLSQMNDNLKRYDMEKNSPLSESYKKKVDFNATMSGIGAAVAGAGALCVGVTLLW